CAAGLWFFADEFDAFESIKVRYQLARRHQLLNLKARRFGRQFRILFPRGRDAVLNAVVFEINQIRTVWKFEGKAAVGAVLRDVGRKSRDTDGFVASFSFGRKDDRGAVRLWFARRER